MKARVSTDVNVEDILACLKVNSTECRGIVICPTGCRKNIVEYNILAIKLCRERGRRIDVTCTAGVQAYGNCTVILYCNRPLEVVITGIGDGNIVDSAEIEATGSVRVGTSPNLVITTSSGLLQ